MGFLPQPVLCEWEGVGKDGFVSYQKRGDSISLPDPLNIGYESKEKINPDV